MNVEFITMNVELTTMNVEFITMNVEFNPTANIAVQNFRNCEANKKKFQHNHQTIGNQQKQSTTFMFIASLDNKEDLDQEQVKAIKVLLSDILAQGGMGGGRQGRVRGEQAGVGSGQ